MSQQIHFFQCQILVLVCAAHCYCCCTKDVQLGRGFYEASVASLSRSASKILFHEVWLIQSAIRFNQFAIRVTQLPRIVVLVQWWSRYYRLYGDCGCKAAENHFTQLGAYRRQVTYCNSRYGCACITRGVFDKKVLLKQETGHLRRVIAKLRRLR